MKIADLKLTTFRFRTRTVRDYEGHPHIGDEHWATNRLLTVVTDEGAEGHFICGGCTPEMVEGLLKPALIGEDPFFREMLHQRMQRIGKLTNLGEMAIGQVDNALWDLAGRTLGHPGLQDAGRRAHQGAGLRQHDAGRRRPRRPEHDRGVRERSPSNSSRRATVPSSCTPGCRRSSPSPTSGARRPCARACARQSAPTST